MGERAEIAARAHRAVDRHEGDDAAVEHRLDRRDQLRAQARAALEEGVEADGEDGAHDVGLEVVGGIVGVGAVADAHGVREQEVAL